MRERPGAMTFQGSPLTLVGPALSPGDEAPDYGALIRAAKSLVA